MPGGAEHGGDFLIARTAGGIDLIFFANPEAKPGQSPIIVFTLAEGGIDGIVEGLAKKGATIVTPLSEAPGGWSADLADPGMCFRSTSPKTSRVRRVSRRRGWLLVRHDVA